MHLRYPLAGVGRRGRLTTWILTMLAGAVASTPAAHGQTPLVTVTTTGAYTITTNLTVPASGGTTYVLQKAAAGRLTVQGQLTGGAGSILRTTTDTAGDNSTVLEFTANNAAYHGAVQTWRGIVQVDNANALGTGTIYCDGNASLSGDLSFANSFTFTNALVLQEDGATLSPGTNTVTLAGPISAGGAAYGWVKYGAGRLILAGANSYGGSTVIGGSGAAGGTLALGVNNGLPTGNPVTINNIGGAATLDLGPFNQTVGNLTLYAGNAAQTAVTGIGTLQLNGNCTLVDAHTTAQDYPLTIATPMDLNGAVRTFTVGYGNNAGSGDFGDLHLNGVIFNSTGTAGLTFTNFNNGIAYYGSVTLGAANTYNGPTTLAGGAGNGTSTLALNANNALPDGSAFVQGANTLLDLTTWGRSTGIATGIGSLTGAGAINLGTTGSLSIGYDNTTPAPYSGVIDGAGGAVVKVGTGVLTLTGVNTYTGPTSVSNGTLQVNGALAAGTAVTVTGPGTLNGIGTLNGPVAVQAGGTLAAGGATPGILTLNNTLTLAAGSTTRLRLDPAGTGVPNDAVQGLTSVTYGGTLVVTNVGVTPAGPATFTLFNAATYAGQFASLQLPAPGVGLVWSTTNLAVNGTLSLLAFNCTLTYAAGPNGTVSGASPQTVGYGGNGAPVTAVPNPGYRFANWSDGGTANPRADLMVTTNLSVTANFTPANGLLTLTYLAGPGGGLSGAAAQTVAPGGVGTPVTAVPSAGGHFVNWSDGATANPRTDGNVTSNLTVTANFATNGYTLTYTAGPNGAIAGPSPQMVNYGGAGAPVTATPNVNYYFVNWSDGAVVNPRTDSNVTANLNVTANFATNRGTFTLTYLAGFNGSIAGATPQTVPLGGGGTAVTAVPNPGYAFVKWSDGAVRNPRAEVNVTNNLTLTASFLPASGFKVLTNATLSSAATAAIAAGNLDQSWGTLSLLANATATYAAVTGAGTLQFITPTNNAVSPDLYFNANDADNATANWGTAVNSVIDLNGAVRYFHGKSNHNGVGRYGLATADCLFNGNILDSVGGGGMTFIAQDTFTGSPPMEVPFCLNGVNTFTGPVEIQRGAVYLGSSGAFPAGNVLRFNPAAGNTAKFFLYGQNATVADLQSTGGGGTNIIADGNLSPGNVGPATLTVIQNHASTYGGAITDTNSEYNSTTTTLTPTLSLVKAGPAALTLTGTLNHSGRTVVNAGRLNVNGTLTGGAGVYVNNGGTLGGTGVIAAPVNATNGAALTAGSGAGPGVLVVNSLALGANPATDAVGLSCEAVPGGVSSINIRNRNGLTNQATVTVSLTGVLPAATPAVYNLITYTGTVAGGGTFILGAVPDQAVAFLTNNAAAGAWQLVVTAVTIPSVTWVGSPTNDWDLAGGGNWVQSGTSLTAAYADNDTVGFGDAAANFLVNLAGPVAPNGVIITNQFHDYTISGTAGITGYTGLTKTGNAALTLATTNSYSGDTVVAAGTLALGAATALPGGPGAGNVTVNGTLDLAGFSPTLNNLAGTGTIDNRSAGGAAVLTVAGGGATTFGGVMQSTGGGLSLAYSGSATLSLAGNNTYAGGTVVNSGTVQVGAGGTTGAPGGGAVTILGTLAFARSDNYTNANDLAGPGGVRQNGPGTTVLQGNLTYTGPTVVNAGVLALPKDHTFDAATGTTLNLAAGAVARISGTVVNLNINASAVAVDAGGAGTLQLASTLNSIESYSDLNFGPNQNGATQYGCRLGCNLDLGAIHRTLYGWSGRNDVARFGLTGCDCQFAGSITGSAQFTLRGQNSFPPGTNTLETTFAFNGSNAFTGQLEIQRGAVYLGHPDALRQGAPLLFAPAPGVNSRLFLYGFNANVADLQSTAYGTSLIANGNGPTSTNAGPATLTVTQNNPGTFSGNIVDWYTEYAAPAAGALLPTLGLVKNGAGTLTLAGTNTYTGPTTINAGKLVFNNGATGGGAVTVNPGATLAGNGWVNSTVTVNNGGAIETGTGHPAGNLGLRGLVLGKNAGDAAGLRLTAGTLLQVTNQNGVVLNGGPGTVALQIAGAYAAPGQYPLVKYQGTLGGAGFPAFQLAALPPGVIGYLSNNAAGASVDLVVTRVTVPRWSGALSPEWSVNPLAAPKNWVLDADGVTPLDYADGEAVLFTDTAAGTTVNLGVANVLPFSVTVSNALRNYTFGGGFGIAGAAALTKLGAGVVTLGTSNAYTGDTTVTAGTLALGSAAALPGGPGAGNLMLNGVLDLRGFSPTVNNLSGSGVVENLTAGGFPVLTVMNSTATVFAGALRNTSGRLAVQLTGGGTLTLGGANTLGGGLTVSNATLNVTGTIGAGGVAVAAGGTLGGTGTVTGPTTLAEGATLALTVNQPLNVGTLAVNGKVTVIVGGNLATNHAGAYLLLNHGAETGAGAFALVQLPRLAGTGLAAVLVDTNNQLSLVVRPAALTGTIADVKHVVVFVQENRSFDHYFGTLHGVHGFSDRNTLPLTTGSNVFYQPAGTGYELPYHTSVTCLNDLDHSWGATHNAINNGRNDGWIANKGTETMAYHTRADLPYYYQLADAYTVLDDYHCSVLASTDPNRASLMTGMIDPRGIGAATIQGVAYPGGPLIDNTEPSVGWGPGWTTYPEQLVKAGISWKVYQQGDNYDDNALAWFAVYKQAAAGNPLHDAGAVFAANVVTQFQNDVAANTLPAVSWIIGPTAQTEHPPYSPQSGEALTKQFLDALAANPAVATNTVFIWTYDENDGFFDHALPINPPAGTPDEFVGGLPIGLGIRVPAIIISPWTRGGHVCSQVFDHTSVLRFLETWTGVQEPNISAWRRQVTGDLTSAFDFAHPDYSRPSLPATTPIDCASGTTPAVPAPQVVPTQEAGTLTPRPLPYQPNAWAVLNAGDGSVRLILTNSGAASVHFLVVPNGVGPMNPTPYDVPAGTSATYVYATKGTGGNYDLSCHGPNGFQRRFAGNVTADANQIEAVAYLNPATGGLKLTLANATAAPVTFTVTNGYATNGAGTYVVRAAGTQVVDAAVEANAGFHDLAVTAGPDGRFLRRFLGRVETNAPAATLVAAPANGAGAGAGPVGLTATYAGYGTPGGTVQFRTNGVAAGGPVGLMGGTAALTIAALGCGSNALAAEYSGDLLNAPATNQLALTVANLPPTIFLPPAGRTNLAGTAAGFTVGATACEALSYQWWMGTNLLAGATNSTLTLASVGPAEAGNYSVVVTSAGGATTSAVATLTVVYQAPNVSGGQVLPAADGFHLTFAGPAGQTYQVLAADQLGTPLAAWSVIGTGTFGSGAVVFTDPQAALHPGRFYRIKSP